MGETKNDIAAQSGSRVGLGRVVFGCAIAALVLWKVLPSGWSSSFNLNVVWAAIVVQPLILLGFILNAMRFGMLTGLPMARLQPPLAAMLLSYGMNLLLPGRIAELLKTSYLHANADVPMSKGLAALFLERTVDVLILAGVSLIGLLLLATTSPFVMLIVAIALALILVFFPKIERYLAQVLVKLPWPWLAGFSSRFVQHVSTVIREKVFFRALFLAVLTWMLSFLSVFVFLKVAGVHGIDLKGALMVFVGTTVGGAIPALPGGFGAYEAAAIFTLRPYGYDLGEAFALGMGLHLTQYIIPLIGTGVILGRNPSGVRALLKRVRSEVQFAKEAKNG